MGDPYGDMLPEKLVLIAHVGDVAYGPGPAIKALDNCIEIIKSYELLGKALPEDFSIPLIVSVCGRGGNHIEAMLKILPMLKARYRELDPYLKSEGIYEDTYKNIASLVRDKQFIATKGFDMDPSEPYYGFSGIVWRKLSILQESRITKVFVRGKIDLHVPPIKKIIGNDDFYHTIIEEYKAGRPPEIRKIYLSNPGMWKTFDYSMAEMLLTFIYAFPRAEIHTLLIGQSSAKFKEEIAQLKKILSSSKDRRILDGIVKALPDPQDSLTVNLSDNMVGNIVCAEGIGTAATALEKGALFVPMLGRFFSYGLDDILSVRHKDVVGIIPEGEKISLVACENKIILQAKGRNIKVFWEQKGKIMTIELDEAKSKQLWELMKEYKPEQEKMPAEIAILCGRIPRLTFIRHKDESSHNKLKVLLPKLCAEDGTRLTMQDETILLEALEGIKTQFLETLKNYSLTMIAMRQRLREIYAQHEKLYAKGPFLAEMENLATYIEAYHKPKA